MISISNTEATLKVRTVSGFLMKRKLQLIMDGD
jgi:hypothetical protein